MEEEIQPADAAPLDHVGAKVDPDMALLDRECVWVATLPGRTEQALIRDPAMTHALNGAALPHLARPFTTISHGSFVAFQQRAFTACTETEKHTLALDKLADDRACTMTITKKGSTTGGTQIMVLPMYKADSHASTPEDVLQALGIPLSAAVQASEHRTGLFRSGLTGFAGGAYLGAYAYWMLHRKKHHGP